MDDVPLDLSPVYRNLSHRSAFLGLTPLDLPVIFIPGNLVLLAGVAIGFSSLWGVVLSAALAAGLVAFKWRKPDDYFETMLLVAFTPRRLSHKTRDLLVRPFPLNAAGERR